jgi:hypothetical protein
MSDMKRGSTYPIVLSFEGIDLTAAEWLIVSIRPKGSELMEFDLATLDVACEDDVSTVTVRLSQAQSLACRLSAKIDVNWMLNGERGGAVPETVSITDTLLGRVVGT